MLNGDFVKCGELLYSFTLLLIVFLDPIKVLVFSDTILLYARSSDILCILILAYASFNQLVYFL